ncbi:hypothetical protein MNB_SM-7-1195 [hydrothermal vent metagenome]|uniref:Outer membrane protein beta-barrel domain-containing protein n=1 Tax=hydrothermal vent metagenome TaxID=652676 RepID=A0A1W1BES3_9ZZZZ
MKKITLSLLSAALLTTSAFAETNSYISIDGGSIDLGKSSTTVYGFSYGLDYISKKGVYAGMDIEYLIPQDATLDSSAFFTAGIELGYEFINSLDLYGHIDYTIYDIFDGITYGTGAKYHFNKYIALKAQYTTGTLSGISDMADLDYTAIYGGLEFNFYTK